MGVDAASEEHSNEAKTEMKALTWLIELSR